MKMSIFMNNTFPRRSLSRLAGVCAALLLLTACGAPASSASSSAAAPSATAEPTPAPTAAPKLYQASEIITVPDGSYTQTITSRYSETGALLAETIDNQPSGFTETVTRDFDTLAGDGLYIETTVMDTNPAGTEMISHNRISDDQMVYYHSHFADRGDVDLNYEYDDHGNLTRTWGSDSSGECDQRMENHYDEAGNLVEAITYYDGEENMRSTYTYLPLEEVLYTEAG